MGRGWLLEIRKTSEKDQKYPEVLLMKSSYQLCYTSDA